MPGVATNVFNRLVLTGMTGVAGELKDATAHIFVNDIQADGDLVKADLVEAAFGGYPGGVVVVWGLPWTDGEGLEHVTGPTLQATCTDSVTPQTAFGYYVLSVAAGTPLILCERFLVPVQLGEAGQAVFYTPDYILGR